MTASNKKKGVRKASVKAPKKKSRKSRWRGGDLSNLLSDAIGLFTVLIDRFFTVLIDRLGLPGALLVFTYLCVQQWATPDQKRAIIQKYVLGEGISEVYPWIIIGIIAAVLLAAQHHHWKKRVGVLEHEIQRLADWKSDHQESKIEIGLHHTKA